ncbi:unnamed protein product, partial [Laminaria digitata]
PIFQKARSLPGNATMLARHLSCMVLLTTLNPACGFLVLSTSSSVNSKLVCSGYLSIPQPRLYYYCCFQEGTRLYRNKDGRRCCPQQCRRDPRASGHPPPLVLAE